MFIQMQSLDRHYGKVSIIEGIIFLIIGCFVIFESTVSSEAFTILLGVLMLFLVYHSLKKAYDFRHHMGRMFLEILVAILYAYVAYTFITQPIYGILSIALIIGWGYIFMGAYELILSIQDKEMFHRGLVITGSVIDILLGLFLVLLWPIDSIIVVAAVIAVEIITSGIVLIDMGVHALKE